MSNQTALFTKTLSGQLATQMAVLSAMLAKNVARQMAQLNATLGQHMSNFEKVLDRQGDGFVALMNHFKNSQSRSRRSSVASEHL